VRIACLHQPTIEAAILLETLSYWLLWPGAETPETQGRQHRNMAAETQSHQRGGNLTRAGGGGPM
jgi:hypothetical protein